MRNKTYDYGICHGLKYALIFHVPPRYRNAEGNTYNSILKEFSELMDYKPKGVSDNEYIFWWPTHRDSMLIRMEVVDNIIMRIEEEMSHREVES